MNPMNQISPRSLHLMNADDTALVVIDLQEKLLPLIRDSKRIAWNVKRLLSAAEALGVRVVGTEQYPQGLGSTVDEVAQPLRQLAGQPGEKKMFSCRECTSQFAKLNEQGITKLLLCGIETHVCVAQTALDMLAAGFSVYLAVDAVGTRHAIDHDVALRRLESSGCTLTTTEAAMFEWCTDASNEHFKTISVLVRETLED